MNEILNVFPTNIPNAICDICKYHRKGYLIMFTPRSGSSLLTKLITKTNCLGIPEEWYNPAVIKMKSIENSIGNFNDYMEFIQKNKITENKVFGLEITMYQLQYLLEITGLTSFLNQFNHFFFLYQDNFILQSISLYKAIQTQVFHSYRHLKVNNQSYDKEVVYDAHQIKSWIEHIIELERFSIQFFFKIN